MGETPAARLARLEESRVPFPQLGSSVPGSLAWFKVNPTEYCNQLGAEWVEVCVHVCACACGVCVCVRARARSSEENPLYPREVLVYHLTNPDKGT